MFCLNRKLKKTLVFSFLLTISVNQSGAMTQDGSQAVPEFLKTFLLRCQKFLELQELLISNLERCNTINTSRDCSDEVNKRIVDCKIWSSNKAIEFVHNLFIHDRPLFESCVRRSLETLKEELCAEAYAKIPQDQCLDDSKFDINNTIIVLFEIVILIVILNQCAKVIKSCTIL